MDFPIEELRGRFPALASGTAAEAPVYFDNPAGTQVPESVAAAVSRCLLESNANLGGFFATSEAAGRVVAGAHRAMADFLGAASPQEVVIGPSMTTLTFQISRSLGRRFAPGDEIIVTRMDHDGDVAPWLMLAEDLGLEIRWLPFDRETWRIEPEALEAVLTDRTRLLALNYASNMTGSINEVADLAERAKAAEALVYVDAVQFAPHGLIDVAALGCDFLVCSSYKFFGPHLGILWGRRALLEELPAYRCRCADDAPPGKFETGTPQIELLAGLEATVDHFAWLGARHGAADGRRGQIAAAFEASKAYEAGLTRRLIEGLQAIPGAAIQGITNPNRLHQRVPTVSFVHTRLTPPEIAQALAGQGIYVWSGHNYALETARFLGLDETLGVLRIGLAHYNTEAEVERSLAALRRLLT